MSTSGHRPKRLARRALCVIAAILLIYAFGCAVPLYFAQDQMVFARKYAPPPLVLSANDKTIILRRELESGGRVDALFYPAPGADAAHPSPVVVFFHGNGEIVDYLDNIATQYHQLGCSMLLPEYRGYGRSGGKPSQNAIRSDAAWFYDQIIKRPDVDPKRIVFHGRSLGGGVAADVATVRRPAALILQSTFVSVSGMAWRHGAPPFLVKNPFRTDHTLRSLDVPILIFHGTRDTILPVRHGRRLHELAPTATYIEYDADHDFPGLRNSEAYWREIMRFLVRSGIIAESNQSREGAGQ